MRELHDRLSYVGLALHLSELHQFLHVTLSAVKNNDNKNVYFNIFYENNRISITDFCRTSSQWFKACIVKSSQRCSVDCLNKNITKISEKIEQNYAV